MSVTGGKWWVAGRRADDTGALPVDVVVGGPFDSAEAAAEMVEQAQKDGRYSIEVVLAGTREAVFELWFTRCWERTGMGAWMTRRMEARIRDLTALLRRAKEFFGERCADFDPGCVTCRWWALADDIARFLEERR